MKTKTFLLIFSLLTTFVNVYGGDIDLIPPSPPGDGNDGNGRSIEYVVTANYYEPYLTVDFNGYSISLVCITETTTNVSVFEEQYGLNSGLQIDISSVPAGSYTLYIYAYGIWWYGTFEIE